MYADPLAFVMWAFPWGSDGLQDCDGPDAWQKNFLKKLGKQVIDRGFDGKTPVEPIRCAISSGHGIGKSALVAWLILWILGTRPNSKGTVTANTASQLFSKTWPELGKWYNLFVAKHWFMYNSSKGHMHLAYRGSPQTWRCDAQTCAEENSESFAGQHAATSTSFYIFDEASAVPDSIWEVAEGGLTDGEPMHFVFGNPTRNSGRFRECFRKFKKRWITKTIDSRKVKITNKSLLKTWVDDYGENSDFVKIRIRGEFPSQSLLQYISGDLISAARGRHLPKNSYKFAPSVLGVDPAWTGRDEFVIVHRQGLFSEVLEVFEKNDDDIRMARIIAAHEDRLRAAAVFVDLGYGTGIVSAGRAMGRGWRLINFAGKSPDVGFANMRAYMWGQILMWLREGGALPEDAQFCEELASPETVSRLDGRIQLESKEHMQKRGLSSPGRADALGLTFALPVRSETTTAQAPVLHDFDPYESDHQFGLAGRY